MPVLPSWLTEPLWDQFAGLLPTRPEFDLAHPLGCRKRRIGDRIIFDKLLQVLRFGCSYEAIADSTCSATTDPVLFADLVADRLERINSGAAVGHRWHDVIVEVFRCVRCGTGLSVPTARTGWAEPTARPYQHEIGPSRVPPGTHAIDPAPFGPPWLPLDAERSLLLYGRTGCRESTGPCDTVVLAPGDVRNTHLIVDKCDVGCLGLNGAAGPNMACDGCGAAVATRLDDCGYWQEVRLDPRAVVAVRVPDDRSQIPPAFGWQTAEIERLGAVPHDELGWPDWAWFGALTVCAAKVLARSGGTPIYFPDGPATPIHDLLARALRGTSHASAVRRHGVDPPPADRAAAVVCDLADPDQAVRESAVAGPVTDMRVLLVVPEPAEAAAPLPADRIPLAAGVWSYLFHDQTRTTRALARTHWRHISRAEFHRDESPPATHRLNVGDLLNCPAVLECLPLQPESREPWLRDLIDELRRAPGHRRY